MRRDVASILIHMGHVLDRDFEAYADSRDSVAVKWFSQAPMPDEKAIDAAALEMEAAKQAEDAKRVESTTARDDAKRALTALDTIIAGAPTATTAHLRAAVEQMARIQKHIILATVGR